MPSPRPLLPLGAALLAACVGSIGGGPPPGGPDAARPDAVTTADAPPLVDARPDRGPPPPSPSQHPIDLALWPRLWAEGATEAPAPADAGELCRRLALELLGHVPSRDERTRLCRGTDAEATARAMMGEPGFVERERRVWIQLVGADPTDMLATHIVDADRLYDALARGELAYEDFAARLVAHPVLAVQRPATSENSAPSVKAIFNLFLGRLPTGRELPDFANLLRPWRRSFEPRCSEGYAGWRRPAILQPDVCPDAVLGPGACTSIALGTPTVVAIPPGVAPTGFDVPCKMGQVHTDAYYYETFHGGMVPPALQTELERPGRLLATRPEFWDQAAELALARLLGWWRSSADEPDTIVPEVRRVTAEWFRARPRHDLRELYVFIATSMLVTRSGEVPAATEPARTPWSTGATRLMDGQQFLDSLEVIFGREIGLCDPHTDEPVGMQAQFLTRLRATQPADFYGWRTDRYFEWGQRLGSCRGAVKPPATAGLEAIFAHAEVADVICREPGVLPAGFDVTDRSEANVDRLARDLFDRAYLRAPTQAETDATRAAARTCAAATDCTAATFARELCAAVVRSAAFTHY